MANSCTIVGLGEALFDVLPSGRVMGGAPLNVAFHAHQILAPTGGEGVVASRVGTDSLGDEVARTLLERGMLVDHLQHDPDRATSTVTVALQEGQPTYTFAPDIAWDHLEFTESWRTLAEHAAGVCYGTLAQRSQKSRHAIWKFLEHARGARRMFDVNLRQGFYDRESIIEGCRLATLVKLNEEELPIVADLLQLVGSGAEEFLHAMRARFQLEMVVYTRGARGTVLVLTDETVAAPAVSYSAAPHADAVGAGDACSSAILVGLIRGIPAARIGELANHLGAYVASQSGATPSLPRELIDHFA